MDLDTKDALKLFIEHSDRLSPEIIVDKLQSSRRNLYLYLDYLCTKDWETSKKFHAHMVALYADYNREKLLPFLKASDAYPIHVKLNFYHSPGLSGLTRRPRKSLLKSCLFCCKIAQ